MSNTSKTEEGISCPFCMIPQKQIISHIKRSHHTEMQENCKTEDYEPELKRYLRKIKDQKIIKKKKEADPDFFAKRQQKYRMQQLLMNPTEFRRKKNAQTKESLSRLSHLGKAKLVEYKNKWAKLNAARNKTFEAAKKRFHEEIMYGPIFPCVCCHGVYFRHQVVPYNEKLQDKTRAQAKAAEMRKANEKATEEDLLYKMKSFSIWEEEERKKWDEEGEKENTTREEGDEKEEEGKKTETRQKQQDHERVFEGAELEEEQDKIWNAFELWTERTYNITNTLEDCGKKVLLLKEDRSDSVVVVFFESCIKFLDFCEEAIWYVREAAQDKWSLLADNMNDMETWTFEQMLYAKKLAEERDEHKTPQEYLHKLTQKILALLEDQKINKAKMHYLLMLMLEKLRDKIMETFFGGCNCKVKLILR